MRSVSLVGAAETEMQVKPTAATEQGRDEVLELGTVGRWGKIVKKLE